MFNRAELVINVLVVFTRVFLSEAHFQSWTRGERHTGWSIQNTETTELAATELACIFRCFYSPACLAVDYVANTQTCSYSSSNTLRVMRADDTHTTIILRRNTDVYLFVSEIIQYSYTYSDATDACTSLGGRLMTLNELTALYDTGYQMCSCGWVQGNGIYYPMQDVISGCGNKKGIIDCSWATLADAWCTI